MAMYFIVKFSATTASISDILTLCDGILAKVMRLKRFMLVYCTSVTFLNFCTSNPSVIKSYSIEPLFALHLRFLGRFGLLGSKENF